MKGLEVLNILKSVEIDNDILLKETYSNEIDIIEKDLKAKEMYDELIKEIYMSFKLENNRVVVCITNAPIHTIQSEKLKKFILDNFILKEVLENGN